MKVAFTIEGLGFARIALLGLASFAMASAGVVTQDIGTDPANASNWLIYGAGATSSPAMAVNGGISITDTSTSVGTYVTGGSLAQFDGFWVGGLNLFLPAGATSPSLTFTGLSADDRAVLLLNGTTILGDYELAASGGVLVGNGTMALSDGPPPSDFTYTFTGTTSGTITTGLKVGNNALLLVVNNAGMGAFSPTQTFLTSGDATFAILNGSFSYTTVVPEPNTVSLLMIGLGSLAYWLRTRTVHV